MVGEGVEEGAGGAAFFGSFVSHLPCSTHLEDHFGDQIERSEDKKKKKKGRGGGRKQKKKKEGGRGGEGWLGGRMENEKAYDHQAQPSAKYDLLPYLLRFDR